MAKETKIEKDQGNKGKQSPSPSTSRDDFNRKPRTQVNDGKGGTDTTNSTGPGKTTNDKEGK